MSIEEAIFNFESDANAFELAGVNDRARSNRQIANWLQELKERREKEQRGIEIRKPYLTVQVDMDMVNRAIDNLYFECKNCGQKMIPQRKEEES